MQDTKHFAFLMQPTRISSDPEGSRKALGHTGGCIKKAPAEAGASRGCDTAGEGLGWVHGLADGHTLTGAVIWLIRHIDQHRGNDNGCGNKPEQPAITEHEANDYQRSQMGGQESLVAGTPEAFPACCSAVALAPVSGRSRGAFGAAFGHWYESSADMGARGVPSGCDWLSMDGCALQGQETAQTGSVARDAEQAPKSGARVIALSMGGLLGFLGSGRLKINACKFFFLGDFQKHHPSWWDAISLPIADTGHCKTKQARHLCSAPQPFNDFGCCGIHAHNLSAG
jgi:hypothetical protein